MFRLLLGFIFSLIIALAALKKESLSFSGFIGAIILGTFIYFSGGLFFSVIMVSFFVSSSLLTKFKGNKKAKLSDINEKGGKRDILQVAANGFPGLFFSLIFYATNNLVFAVAFAAAFAASNADTWASELGVLSSAPPISIINFKRVEKGMSGAISFLGTFASFLGSLFISFIFSAGLLINNSYSNKVIKIGLIILLAGFIGSLIDSLLGAAIQAKYRCVVCGRITEKRQHHGKRTLLIHGISLINNDAVNFICGISSALIALLLYSLI